MSDISQHGLISTLQRLNENPLLEAELEELGRDRPIALILPCHADELGRPALAGILEQLSAARFLCEVVVPINGLKAANGVATAKAYFAERLAVRHRVLWCDPAGLPDWAPAGVQPGKGTNVWIATGLLAREGSAAVLLTADADVTTFRLEMLARLAFAVACPELGYTFAKSYYPRVTDRIYGRVSRLFFAPLLQAIVRTSGHHPLLDFLRSFRYPLSGECAISLDLARSLPLEAGWGLEVGMLCEIFRRTEPRHVCQVDAGGRYDHKHQPLGDYEGGLVKMCREVAATLFAQLAAEGIRTEGAFFDSVIHSYRKEAAEAVRRSFALARINALQYPRVEEEAAIYSFEEALKQAAQKPGAAILPAWAAMER